MEAGREGERREADGRDARHKMTGGEGMVAVQAIRRWRDGMGIVIGGTRDGEGMRDGEGEGS